MILSNYFNSGEDVAYNVIKDLNLIEQSNRIFNHLELELTLRIVEIKSYLKLPECAEFSNESIRHLFKKLYYEQIIQSSVLTALSKGENHDVLINIKTSLCKRTLNSAIYGITMIKAFTIAIDNVNTCILSPCRKSSKLKSLNKKFLHNS